MTHVWSYILGAVVAVAHLLSPLNIVPLLTQVGALQPTNMVAAAAVPGVPFGGIITSIVPCMTAAGPALWFAEANPAGKGSGAFIITGGTFMFPFLLPTHPLQAILGMADVPMACTTGNTVWPGLRVQYFGTSLVP